MDPFNLKKTKLNTQNRRHLEACMFQEIFVIV